MTDAPKNASLIPWLMVIICIGLMTYVGLTVKRQNDLTALLGQYEISQGTGQSSQIENPKKLRFRDDSICFMQSSSTDKVPCNWVFQKNGNYREVAATLQFKEDEGYPMIFFRIQENGDLILVAMGISNDNGGKERIDLPEEEWCYYQKVSDTIASE